MANAEKTAVIEDLAGRFRDSNGAVLTEYRGLTVAQLSELRGSLRGNATFTVTKNTLAKVAATEAGLGDQVGPMLSGPSAIAFVEGDVSQAAKGLLDFAKANPLLVIKGGVLDGKALTAVEVGKLADLEPREVLLAKLAGAMKASMAGRQRRSTRCRRRWRCSPTRCAPSSRPAARPTQWPRHPRPHRRQRTPRQTPRTDWAREGSKRSWRSSAALTCSTRSRR
jgi:large subunit ribosomal protein L10